LAYQGIDFRDLWRRGSGLTLRRLWVLLKALPPDAPLWAVLQAEHEKSLKPTPEQIRERARYYEQRAKEAQ
jgi:hypothetical protein